MTLEGLALTIDPKYRVLAAAYPYVARRILLDAELRSSRGPQGAPAGTLQTTPAYWGRMSGYHVAIASML